MKLNHVFLFATIFTLCSFFATAEEVQTIQAPEPVQLQEITSTPQEASIPTKQEELAQTEPDEKATPAPSVAKIKRIAIEGNERTEDATILSYINFSVGSGFNQQKSEESLRTLYATGLFSSVDIHYKGQEVVIKVTENPIISKIVFEGNDALKTDTLMSEISLKPRMVFSKAKVQSDTNRIVEIYSKTGRFDVVVKPQIIELSQNRVNLVFDIHEGKKARIGKIFFTGNKHFSSTKLQSAIMSKESKFYNFFARTDHYDSDLVENDKLLLTRFYNSQGYANFRVISATADIVPAQNIFYLTFSVEEGDKYDFGTMSVESSLPQVNTDDLQKAIQTKQGDTFNTSLIENTTEAMLKILANQGYPFVNIDPVYNVDDVNKTISIKYTIGQARKIYIGQINIKGNLKTYDNVIRREFRIAEGDPYNEFLLNRSEQRLTNLDFFEKVSVKSRRTDRDDIVDVDVDVQEKSTASLKFSVGFSTTDGMFGMVGLTERNFVGKGQELSAGITKSANSFGGNVGFVEPYFMDQNLSAGVSFFTDTTKNHKNNWGGKANTLAYNTAAKGGSLNFGYDLTEYLYHSFGYTLEQVKITGVQTAAPAYIQLQSGTNYASILSQGFTYDRTDNQIIPHKGYIIKFNQSVAGLGGNSKYLKHIFAASYYYPVIKDKVTLKIGGSAATVNSLGQTIRVNENFNLGDASFRGFEYGGIGPRDKTTGDALGGTMYYKGTTELTFPLGLPEEFDVSGAVFSDFGSLWHIDLPKNNAYPKSNFYDSSAMRVSGGVGFLWITKMGPLRIDFARAFKKQSFDETQLVHFSFSTNF